MHQVHGPNAVTNSGKSHFDRRVKLIRLTQTLSAGLFCRLRHHLKERETHGKVQSCLDEARL